MRTRRALWLLLLVALMGLTGLTATAAVIQPPANPQVAAVAANSFPESSVPVRISEQRFLPTWDDRLMQANRPGGRTWESVTFLQVWDPVATRSSAWSEEPLEVDMVADGEVARMRRSRWVPVTLAVLLLLLVVSGQLGADAEDWSKGLIRGLEAAPQVGWPILASAAILRWFQTRSPAIGSYAAGLSATAVANLWRPAGWPAAILWLVPLSLIGFAAAAILWGSGGKPQWGRLSQGLAVLTVATAGLHWLYLLTPAWHGGSYRVAAAHSELYTAYSVLLTIVASGPGLAPVALRAGLAPELVPFSVHAAAVGRSGRGSLEPLA